MKNTGKFSSSLLHPRYWFTWFGLGILWLLVQLPYPVLMRLGAGAGKISRHFLQRRERGAAPNGVEWAHLEEVVAAEEGEDGEAAIHANAYFASHPEMVLGRHGWTSGPFGLTYDCARDGRDLDAALAVFRDRLADALGEPARQAADAPGAGAAGGVGYAALAVLGAERRPGIDVVLDLVGLDVAVAGADLLLTGEGSLDEQSLGGKTPLGVLHVGRRHGVPVVAVCGRTTLDSATLREAGFTAVHELRALAADPETSMRGAPRLLREVGRRIASQ